MKSARASVRPHRRGDVYLVNFDPTLGSEIKKTRPALIIQNDIANRYSPVTIVVALTTYRGGEHYPTEVLIPAPEGVVTADSLVLLNQIRTIDNQRLVKRLDRLNPATLQLVNRAIAASLGLADI